MESSQGMESARPSVPKIEYDPSLQREDVPYKVNVDAEKCTQLFRQFGISDDAIRKFKIKLKRKPLLRKGPVGGYSSISGDTITIYTDVLWQREQKKLNRDPKTKSILEKGVGIIKKISGGEYGNPVGLFLHESKHAFDFKNKIVKPLGVVFQFTYYIGGAIGVGVLIDKSVPIVPLNHLLSPLALFSIPIIYATDPLEVRARRFASQNRDNPKWDNILTITPKQKQ